MGKALGKQRSNERQVFANCPYKLNITGNICDVQEGNEKRKKEKKVSKTTWPQYTNRPPPPPPPPPLIPEGLGEATNGAWST